MFDPCSLSIEFTTSFASWSPDMKDRKCRMKTTKNKLKIIFLKMKELLINKKYIRVETVGSVPVARWVNHEVCWRLWVNWSNTETGSERYNQTLEQVGKTNFIYRAHSCRRRKPVCFKIKMKSKKAIHNHSVTTSTHKLLNVWDNAH